MANVIKCSKFAKSCQTSTLDNFISDFLGARKKGWSDYLNCSATVTHEKLFIQMEKTETNTKPVRSGRLEKKKRGLPVNQKFYAWWNAQSFQRSVLELIYLIFFSKGLSPPPHPPPKKKYADKVDQWHKEALWV